MSQQEPLIGGAQKAEAKAMEEQKPIVKAIPIRIINGAGSSGEPPLKKKRGRPRKYGPHAKPLAPVAPTAPAAPAPVAPASPGSPAPVTPADPAAPATVAPSAPESAAPVSPAAPDAAAPASPAAPDAAAPVSPAAPATSASAAAPFTFAAPAAPDTTTAPAAAAPPPAAAASADPVKKRRGRPRGSSNKHGFKGKGPAEASMVPHVIIVKTGEDLSEKLRSLSLNGPRNICILAASGEISNITLRKPDTSAGVVTYEGRFEILTLGGSFLFPESGDEPHRFGGINVSFSCPDGRLMGGGVAGQVVAASPIQVVVASFGREHGRDE